MVERMADRLSSHEPGPLSAETAACLRLEPLRNARSAGRVTFSGRGVGEYIYIREEQALAISALPLPCVLAR